MFFSGIADEAGEPIQTQIKAHRELGWTEIEVRNVEGVNLTDLCDETFGEVAEKLESAGLRVSCFASQLLTTREEPRSPAMKILVVDDDDRFAEGFAGLFAEEGWQIEFAGDVQTAVTKLGEALESDPFDVIFLDIQLRGTDGMEVLARLREHNLLDRVYVIAISGVSHVESVAGMLSTGAHYFLDKADLVDRIPLIRALVAKGREWRLSRSALRREAEWAHWIAHNMGNYYAKIKMPLKSLEGLVGDIDGARELFDEAYDSLDGIKALRDDLTEQIDLLRSGEGDAGCEQADLREVLRLASRTYVGERPRSNRIRVVEEFEEGLHPVRGSRNELVEVFGNFIANAIKAMPSGGTLTLSCENTNNGVVVARVQDTGVGMSRHKLDRIWEVGYSDWPPDSGERESSGLGLAMARSYIESWGGSIKARGNVGQGAIFEVKLPAVISDQKASACSAGRVLG